MPSLTDKLKALGVQVGSSQIPPPENKHSGNQSILDILPGSWETTKQGDCFVVRKLFPAETCHGSVKLAGTPDLSFFEHLDHLQGISTVPAENYLFIDTETTGLSGGAGTYVFLVGAAKYENEDLHFAQFFLQDPASESAQLAALESFAANAQVVISYNGKSFDLPRIKTRYRYLGWPDPFANIYHLDLLHFARRLWKPFLASCTLGDLEDQILGLQRDNLDIPGWQVSEYFFEYLHTNDPAPLEHVFYHNEIDVLSLAALLDHISHRLTHPLDGQAGNDAELIAIGKYFFSLGLYQEAETVLSAGLSRSQAPDEILLTGKLVLAATHKKARDYTTASDIWQEAAEMGSIKAHIELAKHTEHNLADIESAIHWTLSAIDMLGTCPLPKRAKLAQELDHRLERLKQKAKQ